MKEESYPGQQFFHDHNPNIKATEERAMNPRPTLAELLVDLAWVERELLDAIAKHGEYHAHAALAQQINERIQGAYEAGLEQLSEEQIALYKFAVTALERARSDRHWDDEHYWSETGFGGNVIKRMRDALLRNQPAEPKP